MKRTEALEWAEKIAWLICSGSNQVGKTAVGKQSLMGMLSVMVALEKQDAHAFNPKVEEIVLFGSAAQVDDSDEVGDLDLMIFDNGFYSNILSVESGDKLTLDSGAKFLRDNLTRLLEGWFGFSRDDPAIREILEVPLVDLHVLPITVFTDPSRRREIAAKHRDPDFFENASSAMMRFNKTAGKFVPVSIGYFEQRRSDDQIRMH